jgi:hypothetical protein
MGQPIPTDTSGSPTRWLIVFDRRAATWWASLVACGRRKHARCFGYVPACEAWVFFDCQFVHTSIQVARGEGARRLIAEWTDGAEVGNQRATAGPVVPRAHALHRRSRPPDRAARARCTPTRSLGCPHARCHTACQS